ncbi:MAG: CehA/McbA family metallohydrolase [Gammaproteobacteria bacterium]|nr:CehA/McbA family metallohydrolase [Gammaproteobacteria bacterium]
MSGSLWQVELKTGIAEQLTTSPKYHSSPDWSPDGNWIIYTADDGGQTIQLEILNVGTGVTRTLTNDSFIYTDPVFSPDGMQIAYVSTKPNGYFNVYLRTIRNGRWAGEEVAVTSDQSFGRNRLYFGEWDMHISPAWMPDGKELLIVSNRNVPLGSGNVLRVPAAAKGIEQAKTVLSEQTLYRTRHDVSPDGKRFIFSSTRGAADQFNNLYVQPTDGGEPYKLTFFSHDAFHPRWSPDGEWIVFISNESGLPQLELLETYGGEQRTLSIAQNRWKNPTGWLVVRTIDSETGGLTPSRIHLKASDGKFYAPADAYARVGGGGDNIFHHTGSFKIEVPAGNLRLEAVKGFEFWPEKANVQIKTGEVTSVTLHLKRMTDMAAKGWYSGSTHVHMNYGGNLHNTLQNLMMMSAAEDQDIVNEQVANKDNRILDYQFFIKGGGPHPLSQPDQLLMVGQEYRPPFYGHVFMFGLRDHLISPFTTGYEGTAIESLYPSNTDMLRKAKAQGATVGYVHAFSGENDPMESSLGGAKGFIVDAALGTTDAVEWSAASRAGFYPWYAVLNNGIRVTAVGGEDSISNLHRSKLVGSVRTYVYTGARGLEAEAWFAGLRKGKAFVSTGPLVELTINGMMPGEDVSLPDGGGMIEIWARVRSVTALDKVMLIFNGEVVETLPLIDNKRRTEFRKKLQATHSGWYHLRAEGEPAERHHLDASYAQAFTNPIWITVGNRPVRNKAAAEYAIKWIDKLRRMAEAWPDWRSQKEKDHVFAQFEQARQIYSRLADEDSQP